MGLREVASMCHCGGEQKSAMGPGARTANTRLVARMLTSEEILDELGTKSVNLVEGACPKRQ